MNWGAVNARATGLATHMLRRGTLEALTSVRDLGALAAELRRRGYLAPDAGTQPAALDLAVRRGAAATLRRLARWCDGRPDIITVVYEDEDRRSLRALIRGALERAEPGARMAGLIPTPALPERALGELARQATPAALAAQLVAWNHPYGSPLLAAATVVHPDPVRLEFALAGTFAARALQAGRAGGARLLAYVRELIDIENAFAAVVLAEHAGDVAPKELFLAGGRRVTIAVFEEALATGRAAGAVARLGDAFTGTALARAFTRPGGDLARLESAVLVARMAALRHDGRLDPLGPAPLLGFALRLRAQVIDLQRIVWGVALAAPGAALAAGLVTP